MLTMRIYFYCQLVVIAAILALIPPAVQAENLSKSNHRILKSASELDYPPFALVRSDGSADGFSVDLLKAVTQAVRLEINFSVGPWHEIKKKLEERHLDVLPLVAYALERDKMFDFTVPYLRMHGTIFVRKGEKSIHSKADLKDKEVMVMRSDAAHEYVVRENLSDKLVLTDSFEEAIKLLSEGKHDAVVVQQLVGLQLIKKLGISNVVDVSDFQETSLKPFDKPLSGFEQKFCFAVQEGDRELLALLNEGLAITIANGTYKKLYDKWFSPILPPPHVPLALMLKYLLFSLGPILFLLSIMGLWYLKREVTKKTQSLREEIKERKQTEEQIKVSLKEKEVLLRELYHRTKNNMQVIISMLHLQSQNIEDDNVLEIFKKTENRIKSMALVHEKLYQTKNLSRVDLKEYFNDLLSLLARSYKDLAGGIRINTDMERVSVTIDYAIPCGLIINEIISNSFKHAFSETKKGEIRIGLKLQADGEIEIRVSDDGAGMPEGFDYREASSFGIQTIIALTEHQLQGKLDLNTDKGTEFQIRFKDSGYKERV